jgi:hypothetical protein
MVVAATVNLAAQAAA